jgi:hypothetical protein
MLLVIFISAKLSIQRRPPANADPQTARGKPEGVIQVQDLHGGAARGRAAYNFKAISAPTEMLIPVLRARVEQRHEFAGKRIAGLTVIVFGIIAGAARKPEIVFLTDLF